MEKVWITSNILYNLTMNEPTELLEVYDIHDELTDVMPRGEFYDQITAEFANTGKITKKVKSIRVILMTTDGRIYVQRRSNKKEQNRGLYDKTIGGHYMSGHTWEMTVVREMVEELGIPSVVLPSKDFKKAINTTNTDIIGIFKEIDYDNNFLSVRTTDTSPITQPYMNTFYIGYYDGPIRFHDGEASGIEVHSLEELEKDMAMYPNKYTADLKVMIQKYRDHLIPADDIVK